MTSRRALLTGLPALLLKGKKKPMMPGNPAFGGTVLRIPAEQSPNFVTGVSGWFIGQSGHAEFNDIVVRGIVESGQFIGTGEGLEFLIYAGTPAAGNLLASIVSGAASDAQGNAVLQGVTCYATAGSPLTAIRQSGATVAFYTATSQAGPWTVQASIGWDTVNSAFEISGNGSPIELFGKLLSVTGSGTQEFGSSIVMDSAKAVFASHPGSSGTAESWQAITPFLNGWANDPGQVAAQYRLVAAPPNSVEVIGALLATGATATTFFTLPAAYRPASTQQFACGGTGGVLANNAPFITCDTSGNLSVQRGTIGAANIYPFHGLISLDA